MPAAAAAVPSACVVPLPAAFPLFATGLGALGLLGLRRKRKNISGRLILGAEPGGR